VPDPAVQRDIRKQFAIKLCDRAGALRGNAAAAVIALYGIRDLPKIQPSFDPNGNLGAGGKG